MGLYSTTTTLDLVMVGVNFGATDMTTLGGKAIDQAEAEVNKYLSKRYDISQSTFQTSTGIPPLVRALTEKLSEGYMWQFLSRGGAGKESRERAKELIEEVKENLLQIADYKLDLLNTAGSVLTDMSLSGTRVLCNTTDYTTTFDEDDPLSWAIDSDKLDDIASNRD